MRNCQYWRLKDSRGKPPGLLGWMPTHAVTFLDNHDTGSTQAHWPFPNDKILSGYAYILTHPGIPSLFWDHVCDWGEDVRKSIMALLKMRRDSGITVDAEVKILMAEADLYIAEIGRPAALRLSLGPRMGPDYDRSYWQKGAVGNGWCAWISKAAQAKAEAQKPTAQPAKPRAQPAPQPAPAQPAQAAAPPARAAQAAPPKEASPSPERVPEEPAFEPPERSLDKQTTFERQTSFEVSLQLRSPKDGKKA